MKKFLPLLVVLVLSLLLQGCGSDERIVETERETYFTITEFPFEMDYNGSPIKVKSIELYQWKSEGYQYHPYTIIRLDVSNLTDEQIHWLTTVEDFSDKVDLLINVSYSSEQNELSNKRMPLVINYTNSHNELVYIYYEYYSGTRKDFSDIQVDINIQLEQEEKHEVRTGGQLKEEKYVYTYDCAMNDSRFPALERDVRPDTQLSGEERNMFERGLGNIAQKWS